MCKQTILILCFGPLLLSPMDPDKQLLVMSCVHACIRLPTGDVYFFCGPKMQYCTCNFRWNIAGWYKAFVLWNFVLSTALGVQRLIIQLGLCGLLPGKIAVKAHSAIEDTAQQQ